MTFCNSFHMVFFRAKMPFTFALKKTRASGQNVGKVSNPVTTSR